MDGVRQVKLPDEFSEVIGIGVEVIAVPGLARSAMAAPIMRNTAVSARRQIEHLILECVGAQWPAMAEDDGLTRAPVVIINFRAVRGGDGTHGCLLLCCMLQPCS